MTTRQYAAFSLLELMVTLAIALIISMVAYSSLNHYFIQSKVGDAIMSASEIQTMVTNQIATNGSVTNSGVNLSTPATISRYVDGYSVDDDGVISIITTADAGGITLTLTPVYDSASEQVSWVCAVDNADVNNLVPSKCRI